MAQNKQARRKMFLSVLPGEEIELVLAEDGRIQEYYVEMLHQTKTKGNIYKGVIHNIDSSLQAAFINYGAERNGFLQVDEVHPEYYQGSYQMPRGRFPLLQNVLHPKQELLVQVVKEPTGTKGAFLTTYLSLPGRYFVLTPGREQMGVSRKIDDDKQRDELKAIADKLDPGPGIGLIVRTVALGATQKALNNDLQYLKRLWKEVRKRGTEAQSPSRVYQEMELSSRAIRDYLTTDVTEIWTDDEATADKVQEMVKLIFPRRKSMVKTHTDPETSLFERFNLQNQIEEIYSRTVTLPSGGQIVFDQTEALLAVDINSGKIGGRKNFKDMALKTNMEAAEEIARQLKLRDIGGQIVIDFIEMKDKKHVREVEKSMKASFKNDRARTDVGRISAFGLMEIVRQRMGSSQLPFSFEPCPACDGYGLRRNLEWQSLQALKQIHRELRTGRYGKDKPLDYPTDPEVAMYLQNNKRGRLREMEEEFETDILVIFSPVDQKLLDQKAVN